MSYTDMFFKQCLALDDSTKSNWNNFHIKGFPLWIQHFPIVLETIIVSRNNGVRKIFFLGKRSCWNGVISSNYLDWKFPFDGIFGDGDLYLKYLFRYSKKLRNHATLLVAPEAVWSKIGNWFACYIIPSTCIVNCWLTFSPPLNCYVYFLTTSYN